MRLRDKQSGQSLVVDTEQNKVLADLDKDGRISAGEVLEGPDAERALRAAKQIDELFVTPVPGVSTPDDAFEVRGPVSKKEAELLGSGGSVPVEREALKMHLDFFDKDGDDKFGVAESYEGFRDVGFSPLSAGLKAFMAGVIFGGIKSGLTVDVEGAGSGKRYANSTGIYDRDGKLDEAKLAEFTAEFDKKGGRMTFDEVMELLKSRSTGTVSRNQFKSLFTVCKKLNDGDFVTKEQFRALFDGSLLYLAASVTDDEGKRRIG